MSDITKKVNLFGLIGFIGTIILIVGVFLTWNEITISILSSTSTTTYSGWDIFTMDDASDIYAYYYAPVVALVCGIIALITTILPVVYTNEKVTKILGIVSLILAIVAIVVGFMFYGDISNAGSFFGIGAESKVGIGFWLCIVGAIITALGGIIDIAKKLA